MPEPLLLMIVIVIVLTVIVLAGIAAMVVARNLPLKRPSREYPYERAELFSPAERLFLSALEQAVAGQFSVMGKVRLGDLVKVKPGLAAGSWQSAFNRIQSKHIDFVVWNPAASRVEFVVELDDRSHRQPKRRERDEFVDGVLQAAGIPIIHIPVMRSYSPQFINDALSQR